MGKTRMNTFPLRRHIDALVDELRSLVPKAIRGEGDPVHDARVATRRLKAAVTLLQPMWPDDALRPFARTLRKLRRSFGELRDADVMLEHAEEFSRMARHAAAARWLMSRLQEQRSMALAAVSQKLNSGPMLGKLGIWWLLREKLENARNRVEKLLSQSLRAQIDAFDRQAVRLCEHLEAGRAPRAQSEAQPVAAGAAESQVDPHELRIAGKNLRYTLDMAAVEGHSLGGPVAKLFKRAQTALGLWHDYVVLARQAMSLSAACDLPLHDPVLQHQVLAFIADVLRRSENQLLQVTRLWRSSGREVTQTIHDVFASARQDDESSPVEPSVVAEVSTPGSEPAACGADSPAAEPAPDGGTEVSSAAPGTTPPLPE